MGYQADSVAKIIKRLNVNFFLPAIQREFVWPAEKVIQLFDSLLRNYPISSFLFWELKPENRDKWQVYRFVEDASEGTTHNQLANTNGVQQPTLVLDGQQRLTSLLVGLKGSYIIKKKWKWRDNPDAWSKRRLYLDLLKPPVPTEDGDEQGIRFGLAFHETQPKNDPEHHWIKVGKILDFESEKVFEEFKEHTEEGLPGSVTKDRVKALRSNLDKLYRAVWKEQPIAFHTETDQEYDRVLDIFVRANDGGVKLSKSDLLLSMVTAKWDDMNARDEIYNFVDRLNGGLSSKNDLDKDFVLKTCLVLSDLPVEYKVENFSNKNLETIRKNWKAIKKAVEAGVELVNSFGIDGTSLTSTNALVPVIYYLYQNPKLTFRADSKFEAKNAKIIKRWLTIALLVKPFGGSSDTLLREIRRVLVDKSGDAKDFPETAINKAISRLGRKSNLDEESLEEILDIEYGDRECFMALSLLYEERNWGRQNFHIDHIFPKDLFDRDNLKATGIPTEKYAELREGRNYIANLELLTEKENLSKNSKEFDKWLTTRDEEFCRRHLVPEGRNLYKVKNFAEFVQARRKLIRQKLLSVVGTDGNEKSNVE